MLKLLSFTSISQQGDMFISQFQLRQREFIDRQNYAVKSVDGMEFDQYDTLASKYLVFTRDGRTVLGASRLTPIAFGCMLEDQFPALVDDKSVFTAPSVWEGTRFCIDSRLPAEDRLDILKHICLGYIEFGLARGIDRIIGLMPTLILRSVFERNGVILEKLGAAQRLGDHAKVQAASIGISRDQLERVREATGLRNALPHIEEVRLEHVG